MSNVIIQQFDGDSYSEITPKPAPRFGIGQYTAADIANYVQNANDAQKSGVYVCWKNVPHEYSSDGSYYLVRVDSFNEYNIYQTAYQMSSTSGYPNGDIYYRYKSGSTWSDWQKCFAPLNPIDLDGYIYPLQTYQTYYGWAGKMWSNESTLTLGDSTTDSILISNALNTTGEIGTSNLLVAGYLQARIDKSYLSSNPYTFTVSDGMRYIWVASKDLSSSLWTGVQLNQSNFQAYYLINNNQDGLTYKIYYYSDRFRLACDSGGAVTQAKCPITYTWSIDKYMTSTSSPASSNIFINGTQSYGTVKDIKSAIYN